jgi:hypothetical protein
MPQFSNEIQILDQYRGVLVQEHDLKLYHNAREAQKPLLLACCGARESAERGKGDVHIDHVQFGALVRACEDVMLILVDEAGRNACRVEAEQTASHLTQGLGPIQPIAWAELTLRKLAMLCVTVASTRCPESPRLPQWQEEIDLAKAEFETALTAWTQLHKNKSEEAEDRP